LGAGEVATGDTTTASFKFLEEFLFVVFFSSFLSSFFSGFSICFFEGFRLLRLSFFGVFSADIEDFDDDFLLLALSVDSESDESAVKLALAFKSERGDSASSGVVWGTFGIEEADASDRAPSSSERGLVIVPARAVSHASP
jgi:hypothetical protein